MDNIKVGEYARTLDGIIGEIIQKDKLGYYDTYYYVKTSNKIWKLSSKLIKSHSEFLIDLIEIGDFVNGVEVMSIHYEKGKYDFIGNIETILTREQYENNCYKEGESNG